MKRMMACVGLPVVADGSGKKIGQVERVCLYAEGQMVRGFIVRLNGFGRRRRFVSLSQLEWVGDVSVAVSGMSRVPRDLKSNGQSNLVLDTTGARLGWMTDALLDNQGCVAAVEISKGYVDDLLQGRLWAKDFTIRQDGVIAVSWDAVGDAAE